MKDELRAYALDAGFADMRVCKPSAVPKITERLQAFVDQDRHGQMRWMAERMHWRGDPTALWPEAKSVIMLAEAYTPDHDPLAVLETPDVAAISVYAQGRDYHDIVKKRLKRVGRWLIEQHPGSEIKVFVDTAPVMEKPLAEAAGLGWQGKHTNLLSRKLGNWFFLGAVFTTLEIQPDEAEVTHCGSCTACLDICPTDAFPAPYQLDARKCISYLTIEHSGPIAPELRSKLGNRIYGCDDCLAICPWNKFAQTARDIRYESREDLRAPDLITLAQLDDAAFRLKFSGSPIKRIGRNRFVRNVVYALGNAKNPKSKHVLRSLLDDADETVAEAARWAIERLEA